MTPARTMACLTLLMLAPGALPAVRAQEEPAKEIDWKLSGETRFRPEWRDNADLDDAVDDDLRQGFMRTRLAFEVTVRKDFRVFIQAQDSRLAGEEVSTAANQSNLDLHQGYLELTPGEARAISLRIGRQELIYGDERLIGAFGWDNVGRAFDGLRLRYARRIFRVDGLAVQLSSTPVGGGTTSSDLFGAYAHWTPREGAEYDAYWLLFDDNLKAAGETGPFDGTTIHAVGFRIKDQAGRFDYRVEAAVEKGDVHGDDLSARAAGALAGVTLGDATKLRLFGGYDYATGEEDGADGKRQEFFNFFPTNHPHYGYMDYEGWRNLRSYHAGASLARGRHFVQAKAHHFGLEEETGPWKSAAGAVLGSDPSGLSGSSVGSEIDLTYRFAWMKSVSLEGGLSRFSPGRFARQTRPGNDDSRWAYLMLTASF